MFNRWWRQLLQRGAGSRVLGGFLFLSGLYLVGLPVLYTVFARETETAGDYGIRVLAFVAWIICAVFVGAVATLSDVAELRQTAREVLPRERRAGDRRELAALASIRALLGRSAPGPSEPFAFDAFIQDDHGFLVPVLERRPEPWQRWAPNCGAVGIAWANPNAFVQLVDEQTIDPDLGLTPEQLEHYGHLTFVAARAIFDENDQRIGVLAVSCSDGRDFVAAGGLDKFEVLASELGILIGDARPLEP